MANIVLKSLRVKNFGPFADEIYFTTATDKSKKEYPENTFQINNTEFNRIAFIYGANGSGKSNFCKAILQIQNFINLSPLLATNNPQLLELQPVKLGTNEMEQFFLFEKGSDCIPSEYGIEIVLDDITYHYSFSVLKGQIVSEKLTKKRFRTEVIMSRTSPDFSSIELKSELSGFAPNVSVVRDRVLCLSMAAFLNNPLALKIVSAINDIKVVNMANLTGLRNITQEEFTEEVRKRCLRILKIAEPTMDDLSVEFKEEKVNSQKLPVGIEDLEGREIIIKNVRVDVHSEHSVYDKDEIVGKRTLPFLKIESTGTIKMLSILPLLFEALESGSPIVIDELENGLHPTIVNNILELFSSQESNPLNSQLVCTTHSIPLVEKNVRRDQVWVISKNERGKSAMKRISDYPGTRTTDNIAEKYLRSAFGGVPSFS